MSSSVIWWNEIHQGILELLADKITSAPVLAYPVFNKPFPLLTDASEQGFGAILYQRQEGKLRVIAYSSCILSPAEKNYKYYSWNLEFLALKRALCNQFRDYF